MLTQPLRVTTLLAVLIACLVAGCASRDSAKGKPAQARRSAPRSQVETSRDPPIAADTRYAK